MFNKFKTFKGGVHPSDHKTYSEDKKIETLTLPQKVVIHLSQHIGKPAKPIVKVGDAVLTGQKIAEADGFISCNIHSSISGKVSKIEEFIHPVGNKQMAIEITSDGRDEWIFSSEDKNYLKLSNEEIIQRVKNAGVCGLGGAGFPTNVKITPNPNKPVDTIILNGVECEPFLTADYRIMLEKAEDIIKGLKIVMKVMSAKKGIIGIESNKPKAIKLMKDLLKNEENIEVCALELKYPQGAEKQLIFACTKRKVPNKGGLPADVGIVVQNVATAIAIYKAVAFKKPLISRVVTCSGKIVNKPANLKVRIGTPFQEIIDFCKGVNQKIGKIIAGAPMMGFANYDFSSYVTKGTSGLIILSEEEAKINKEETCLRCGRCVDVCPLNLLPSIIANNAKYSDWKEADKAGARDCMKCACCSYVCPSNIRLIQWIDLAKTEIAKLS